jgi:hypothetical protein
MSDNAPGRHGIVLVRPPAISGISQNYRDPWSIIGPNGEAVSTVDTTTQGLQEAINYSVWNGYPLRSRGRAGRRLSVAGDASTYPPAFFCATPVTIPPCFQQDIDLDNVSLIYTGGGSAAALTINACMMTRIRFGGQVIGNGTGPSVRFQPKDSLVIDVQKIITASRFQFGSVGATGGGGAGVPMIEFDCQYASIIGNYFDLLEVECINAYGYGLSAVNAGTDLGGGNRTVFEQNDVSTPNIHGFTQTGLLMGGHPIAGLYWGANYRGNICRLAGLRGGGPAAIGVNCFGNNNTFIGGQIDGSEGGLANGIVMTANDNGAGGNQNTVLGASVRDNTGPDYLDSGSGNCALINGRVHLPTYTAARLPSAAASKGAHVNVSDAASTIFASIVAGGGANFMPAHSDGSNWRIG